MEQTIAADIPSVEVDEEDDAEKDDAEDFLPKYKTTLGGSTVWPLMFSLTARADKKTRDEIHSFLGIGASDEDGKIKRKVIIDIRRYHCEWLKRKREDLAEGSDMAEGSDKS